ncbi:ABC transporter ATP-binding protein [Candidatus Poribacteria bacterium]|nr:ABC transporter ATP-binding protein [Candidatus Poribacteria bacterium]MYH83530.1 ABC transporter ATP-binding protein [Candidatus Poribacteria bacterium]MYK93942.1 ABC transporter ATP-binding protein [Candidatus Poribacteria bacterium]
MERSSTIRSLLGLKKYVIRYRYAIIFSFFLVVVTNVLLLISPQILKTVVDELGLAWRSAYDPDYVGPLFTISPERILFFALLIFGIALFAGILRFIQRRTIQGVARQMEFHLRADFFLHLQKLSAAYYDNVRTGDLMTRATSDLNAIRMVLSSAVMYTADAIVFFGLALTIMLRIDVGLTLVTLLPYPVLALLIRFLGKRLHARYERIQESFSTLNTKVQENLSGVRVVKAYTLEASEIEHFQELNREFVDRNHEQIRLMAFFFPLFRCLPGIGIAVLIWMGGLRVIDGEMSLGDFVAFQAYLMMLIRPMITLGFIVNTFERGAASMGRIQAILNEKPEIFDGEQVKWGIKDIEGEIEFRDLNFAYPDGTPVLKGINLKIERGKTLAIVGGTGSGKSTLVNLIPRIRQAARGTVFVDGVDIQDIPLNVLRASIGVVEQEPFLFSDYLQNNIAYGLETPDEGQIKDAAHTADLLEQIEEFPDGLETFLGERGMTISGGQRQRTALARAIIIKPKILILDDAFANVDTQTEDTILSRLAEIMKDRTTILISHRISTVKGADHIVVLDEGSIVEAGTHEQLLEQNGIYAGIYETQLLQEELEKL